MHDDGSVPERVRAGNARGRSIRIPRRYLVRQRRNRHCPSRSRSRKGTEERRSNRERGGQRPSVGADLVTLLHHSLGRVCESPGDDDRFGVGPVGSLLTDDCNCVRRGKLLHELLRVVSRKDRLNGDECSRKHRLAHQQVGTMTGEQEGGYFQNRYSQYYLPFRKSRQVRLLASAAKP